MLVTDCLIGRKSLSANAAAAIVELKSAIVDSDILPDAVVELATISGLCNDGEFDATTLHLALERRRIFGDATDQAVLRFAETITTISDVRGSWITAHKVPFNSKNKFMMHVIEKLPVVHEKHAVAQEGGDLVLTIKGAPDILLPWCTHYMTGQGRSEPLTDDHREYVEGIKNNWANQAKRVILIARKALGHRLSAMSTTSNEFDDQVMKQAAYGLELLGLVAIIDPPRDEIPDVIRTLRGAGIKVHMVTGDFGMPQILSSFFMIIICCFTHCAAAIAIAYEKPEADVLLRKPRNPKKDHLVNWQLILFAYGFIGVLETISSFAMSYWYAERQGVPFRRLWFGFGAVPPRVSADEYANVLNVASSVYFVNLVVM